MKAQESNGSLKAVLAALAANTFVTIIKFVGWIISSSPSMLAEALHSFADVLNQSLMFVGIKGAARTSKLHPWGQGAVQYLFNFMSAIGIFTLGCIVTIYHAVHDYLNPQPINYGWMWLNLMILCLSFLIEGTSCVIALKEIYKLKGKKSLRKFIMTSDDPTLVGVFLEDSAAILGILLAISGVGLSKYLGSNNPDIFAAIIIGGMMGLIALFLGIVNARFLIGKSSSPQKELEYQEFIESLPTVDKVMELKSEILGPNKVHLFIKVELHGSLMIDRDQIQKDAQEIEMGNITALEGLLDVYSRAIRDIGPEIISIETKIKKKFREIVTIDFEIE